MKTKHWKVTYESMSGNVENGMVFGKDENEACAIFSFNFFGCTLLTIEEIAE